MALIWRDRQRRRRRRFDNSASLSRARTPPGSPLLSPPPPSPPPLSSHALFLSERIHFARFPFSRTDCACVQSRRTTNGRERLSLHFELRSMCTFRSDDSVFAARTLAPSPNEKCSRFSARLSRHDNLNKMEANKTLLIYTQSPPSPSPWPLDFSQCCLLVIRAAHSSGITGSLPSITILQLLNPYLIVLVRIEKTVGRRASHN